MKMNKHLCSGIVNWCNEPQNNAEVLFRREFNRAIESSRQHTNYQKKKKRFRSLFTTNQVLALENEFSRSPYVNNVQRREIAARINISEKAIKVWFQNRRMKEKQKSVGNEDDIINRKSTSTETFDSKSNLNSSSSSNEGHILSLPVITYETYPNIHQESINKQIVNNNFNDQTLNNEVKVTNLVQKQCNDARQFYTPMSSIESLDLRIKRKQENYPKPDEISAKERKQDEKVARVVAHPRTKKVPSSPQVNQPAAVPSGFVPVYYNRYIPHPYMQGNTAWQPLNILPLITAEAHSPVASNIIVQNQNDCCCNCHKKATEEKPPAQHIVITMPPYDIQHYQQIRH